MRWKDRQVSLGNIKIGKKQRIVYQALEELPEIKTLQSSCGCSIPVYDATNNQIIVTFSPGSVPKHLKGQGYYSTTKTITVTYIDGTKDVLSFTAKIFQRLL